MSPLLRRLNAASVLKYLRRSGPVTGTEVMAATGLSRPTVHAVCNHLISGGWVTERDGRPPEGDGRPGRPARCYEFNATAGYVLGIDLGVHKVSVMLGDLRGNHIGDTTVPFRDESTPARERLTQTRRAIRSVLRSTGTDGSAVLAAAVGVAAHVEPSGHIRASEVHLPGMAHTNVGKVLGRGYDWPVLLENDANLAALGERWRGVGSGIDNLIVMLAGERLGAGLFLDGRLVHGYAGGAGELGLLSLVNGVGNTDGIGYLARIWGAEAVAQICSPTDSTLLAVSTGESASLVGLTNGDPSKVRADIVFEAARAGDGVALAVLERIADRMARVIGLLDTLLNPQVVVIGGGVSKGMDVLLGLIVERLPAFTPHPPQVSGTGLGEQGVLFGALRLALDHVEARVFDSLK
jgi:predicted NBD/HSP70 family sugar kinase